MMTQSILTLDPSILSLDLRGCVIIGAELAKSPSVGGASLTVSLQEARVSPIQLVIITVNVPESSGKARLISSVVDDGALRICTKDNYFYIQIGEQVLECADGWNNPASNSPSTGLETTTLLPQYNLSTER